MTPRIPVPTDNFYKFCALFGTVLFISSFLASIYINTSSNQKVFDVAEQQLELYEDGELSELEKERKKVLEKVLEVTVSSRDHLQWVAVVAICFGSLLMGIGFRVWYQVIQPREDRLINLKIRQLEKELRVASMPKKSKEHPWR